MSTGQSILEVHDVSVSFDKFKALDHLNFSMLEGELRVVIGPNGAGKTTLLDVISGRTRADSGQIRFNGQDITRMADFQIVRRGIGRKFQAPSVFPDLSVSENLALAARRKRGVLAALFQRRDPEETRRINEVLELIDLGRLRDQRAGSLAHGQKQWLEIGMVLVSRPRLMLIDEPIAGMTASEVARTAGLLRQLLGFCSVLVIEHDMNFVREIADRVSVFHQGALLTEGSFDRVRADDRVRAVYLGTEEGAHA
ncbi:urea ABC transporter ATP-binding protein UrtD [Thermithiobacillus plumbiphilus]|uniref:Urea ABC transporter ATP-binding protein UrtD n=1 Tax=Thermithiobacillus plumbiphilus TaxID=1729899 RepID=A0ABU9D9T8_9PROT